MVKRQASGARGVAVSVVSALRTYRLRLHVYLHGALGPRGQYDDPDVAYASTSCLRAGKSQTGRLLRRAKLLVYTAHAKQAGQTRAFRGWPLIQGFCTGSVFASWDSSG